jgi:predicted ATP-binding protein involved in virulence
LKIQKIEIKNYKAFLGTYTIQVGGKNLFIYGENGSGKSSLYYALKDFFQSSIENIDLNNLENVFVTEANKGKAGIKVTFKPGNKTYTLSSEEKNLGDSSDTMIRDTNKLKSFLTYKHLLDIHHLKKNQEVNLFDLLVKGVLRHFKYALTNGKEMGELFDDLEMEIEKPTDRAYHSNKKKRPSMML